MAEHEITSLPPRVKDLSGERFGRLVVIGFVEMHQEPGGRRRPRFLCQCDCGQRHTALSPSLRGGMVKSCGCSAIENGRTRGIASRGSKRPGVGVRHGMSHKPEHNAWTGMKQRCHNPRNKGYVNYGARGIAVCDQWRNSFEAFFADMGPRPSPSHSLERINNDGPYEPGNVRWADDIEQANNKRDSHRVVYQGHSVTLADAERLSGISQKVLLYRVNAGWAETRLFEPVNTSKRNRPRL